MAEKPADSAALRIRSAFLAYLQETGSFKTKILSLPQSQKLIRGVLDAHFRRFCSDYTEKDGAIMDTELFRKTFLLLVPVDYNKLSVTELTRRAGVNRTTFYKIYPDIAALYDDCCEEITAEFLAVPVPEEKTPETLLDYAVSLRHLLSDRQKEIMLLSHRVDRRDLPHLIGRRLQQHLRESLTAKEQSSFAVQENLDMFPELFSVWMSLMQIDELLPNVTPDQNLPPYDPEKSLLENIAAYYVLRYGGPYDLYYAFGIAALQELSTTQFRSISASNLCKAAGYPRSAFYNHFSNTTDYMLKAVENCIMGFLSAFLWFFEHPGALTSAHMKIFRREMEMFRLDSVREIFLNGGIAYLFSVMFSYLMHIFQRRLPKPEEPDAAVRQRALLSCYVCYAMRLFSMYYLGDLTDAALGAKIAWLSKLKAELGLTGSELA